MTGVVKVRRSLVPMLMLSILVGASIGLGALYDVIVRSDPALGFADRQWLGDLVFSSGWIRVVIVEAELF